MTQAEPSPTPAPAPAPERPARLLVVDDNEMNRDMLSRRLAKRGYEVSTASDGTAALSMIETGPFDLVLLDVMMPGIDGFEVLRRVRLTHAPARLPIIMATAKDTAQDVVQALEAGANDYVTKPLEFPVVLARVGTQLTLKRSVDQIMALEQNLKAKNETLERANARMSRDLRSAARLQHGLLPGTPPPTPRARFAWLYVPCDELAGDIFNVFALDERHVAVYLLDVSGHGVPAALLSVTLSRILAHTPGQSSILVRGDGPTPPAEVVGELNRRFPMEGAHPQYFTIIYGVLDTHTGLLRYTCAGHTGPGLSEAGGGVRVLEHPASAVGWEADASFEERRLDLKPGDRVYLYSDGISETLNPARRQLGNAGVCASLERSRSGTLEESLAELRRTAERWGESESFDDDVSAIAVEWVG